MVVVILPVLYCVPFPLDVPDTLQLNCSKTMKNNPQMRCTVDAAAAPIIQFVLMISIVDRHSFPKSHLNTTKNHSHTNYVFFSIFSLTFNRISKYLPSPRDHLSHSSLLDIKCIGVGTMK